MKTNSLGSLFFHFCIYMYVHVHVVGVHGVHVCMGGGGGVLHGVHGSMGFCGGGAWDCMGGEG